MISNFRNDLDKIISQISSKDERLAKQVDLLLRDHIEELIHELDNIPFESREEVRSLILEKLKERMKKRISKLGKINCYPADNTGPCREVCIGMAFNKYGSRKPSNPGFKGVAEWLIEYWLRCNDKNKLTILLTSSWDEIYFINKYKNKFDARTSHKKNSVAILLFTPMSLSLQYLN